MHLASLTTQSLALSDLPNSTFLVLFIQDDYSIAEGVLTDFSPA